MADNTTLNTGSGGDTLATDDIGGVKFPRSKIVIGADGTNDGDVSSANPLPVNDAGGSLTVDNGGTFAVQASQTGTWTVQPGNTANTTAWLVTGTGGTFPVTDNGGSITVDWAGTAPPIGAGLEATALRVTLATDSTGLISVDDNGGSLTVDGTVAVSGSVAVTDNSGSLTVDDGGLTISIDDGAGSITVDGTVAISGTVTTSVSGTVAVTDNSGSLTVDNNGTFAVQATVAAGATNIAKAEDVASADADVGVPSMAVRKATPANTSGTDGDYEFLQMSSGRLWTSSVIDTALPAGTNAIGKLASNTGVTIGAVEIAAAQTLATVTTVTTCSTVTTLTGSGVAHDGVDSGNPHKVGAKATTALSGLTLVANADRTDLFAGVDGVLITRPHCNLEGIVTGNASNTDGTSTQVIAAQAAGIKTYLTSVILTNTSSSNIYVEIKDGTTVMLTIPVPANGGAIFNPPVPIPGTAATAWNFDPSAATTTVYCSAVGFKSKV